VKDILQGAVKELKIFTKIGEKITSALSTNNIKKHRLMIIRCSYHSLELVYYHD